MEEEEWEGGEGVRKRKRKRKNKRERKVLRSKYLGTVAKNGGMGPVVE